MSLENLVHSVQQIVNRPKGFKVFYNSSLNMLDVWTTYRNLNEKERALLIQLFNESFSESVKDINEAKSEEHEKFIALFNALYETSSNLSHIASVYDGALEIIAILHDRRIEQGDIKTGSTNDNFSVKLPEFVNHEVTVLPRGHIWGKNRKAGMYGNLSFNSYSPVELLTIVVPGRGGEQSKVLVHNFPVMANYSFILTAEGNLVRQRYGEHNKFIDVHGNNHFP